MHTAESYQSVESPDWIREDPTLDHEDRESCFSRLVPWLFRLLSAAIAILAFNHAIRVYDNSCESGMYGVNVFDATILWLCNLIMSVIALRNIFTQEIYTRLLARWRGD